MKARKKPVEVECFKYDGDLMNNTGKYYVPDWVKEAYEKRVLFYDCISNEEPNELFVNTLEGLHHVSVGDYVIKGVNGKLYPCKPDIFEKTYDIIEED